MFGQATIDMLFVCVCVSGWHTSQQGSKVASDILHVLDHLNEQGLKKPMSLSLQCPCDAGGKTELYNA